MAAAAVGAGGNVVVQVVQPPVQANGVQQVAQNPVVNQEAPRRIVDRRAFTIAATKLVAIMAFEKFSSLFASLLGRGGEPSQEPEYRNLADRIVADVGSFCTQVVGYSALGGAAVQLVSGLGLTALITAVAAVLLFRADAQLQTSAALQRRIDELGGQILELHQINAQLRGGVAQLGEQNRALQGEVGSLRQEREALTGQVQVLREGNGALQGEVGNLRQEREALTGQVQVLRENNGRQEAFIRDSGTAFNQAHAMYQRTVTEASTAEARTRAATDRLVAVEADIARSVARLAEVDKVFAARIQQLSAEIQKIPPAIQEAFVGFIPRMNELLRTPANADEREWQGQMARAIVANPQPFLRLVENQSPQPLPIPAGVTIREPLLRPVENPSPQPLLRRQENRDIVGKHSGTTPTLSPTSPS